LFVFAHRNHANAVNPKMKVLVLTLFKNLLSAV
jgi:hypothetical protein